MDASDTPVSLIHNRANPVTRDVQRLVGGDGTSVIVKTICPDGQVIVPHWVAGHEASHWNYWSREALAYAARVTDAFASGGIRGPELLDVVESADGSIQLQLEDVDGRSGHDLEVGDHVRFAAGLGLAQGNLSSSGARFATDGASSRPFLSSGWVRSYALSRPAGPAIHDDPAAWEHPVVVEGFGDDRHRLRHRFGELYRQAPAWFDLLESLPRTLCHLDYWPNNAIAAGGSAGEGGASAGFVDVDDVLIDWAFVGDGAVGEDPGNWVPDTILDHFMEPEEVASLDSAVWGAYAAGLEESGWNQPLELARLGMCASAVKYLWLPGLMVSTADHTGPTGYGGQPSYPLVEVFRRRAVVFGHLLDRLDEAAALARTLGLDAGLRGA